MQTAEDYDRYITGLETLYRQVKDYKNLPVLNTVPKKMSEILKGITGENDYHRTVFLALQSVKESIETNKKQPVGFVQSLVQSKLAELIEETKIFRATCLRSPLSPMNLSSDFLTVNQLQETGVTPKQIQVNQKEHDLQKIIGHLEITDDSLQPTITPFQEQHQQDDIDYQDPVTLFWERGRHPAENPYHTTIEYKRILQQKKEALKAQQLQINELEVEKHDLLVANTALETQLAALKQQMEKQHEELNALKSKFAQQSQEQDNYEDIEALRKSLAGKLNILPTEMRELVRVLLEVADHTEQEDIVWLIKPNNIQLIEMSLYPSEATSLQIQSYCIDAHLLYQTLAMQRFTHRSLINAGLEPVCPIAGEKFDRNLHVYSDSDLIYTNDKPYLDRCIHSVRQIGFIEKRSNTVLRKASVRLYRFTSSEIEASESELTLEDTIPA